MAFFGTAAAFNQARGFWRPLSGLFKDYFMCPIGKLCQIASNIRVLDCRCSAFFQIRIYLGFFLDCGYTFPLYFASY